MRFNEAKQQALENAQSFQQWAREAITTRLDAVQASGEVESYCAIHGAAEISIDIPVDYWAVAEFWPMFGSPLEDARIQSAVVSVHSLRIYHGDPADWPGST